MSNLPNWQGADSVYSRAYRVLDRMAKNGHVKRCNRIVGRRMRNEQYCIVSDDMTRLIDALNRGDEECIKGLLLMTHVYPSAV